MLTTLAILFVAPFVYMLSLSFQPLGDMFSNPPHWIPVHPTVANYTGFLVPKAALFSNILLMMAILLWRPQGVYALSK